MEPTMILEKPPIWLVGFSFFGDPFQISGEWTEENEIGRLWNRFMRYMAQHGPRLKHVKAQTAYYEVHIEHEETPVKGHFEIFVGVEVDQYEAIPVDLLLKILPPTTYAVFTLKGQQISADWQKMIAEWLSRSGHQQAYRFGFQLYDQRFKGLQRLEESELDVYLPIQA
jgi:predicted transcriptional regulator YdeE